MAQRFTAAKPGMFSMSALAAEVPTKTKAGALTPCGENARPPHSLMRVRGREVRRTGNSLLSDPAPIIPSNVPQFVGVLSAICKITRIFDALGNSNPLLRNC
jgi:hypothetical protein